MHVFSWRNWLFSWIESTCCMCLFTVWCRGVKVQPQLLIYIQCFFLLVGHILVYAKIIQNRSLKCGAPERQLELAHRTPISLWLQLNPINPRYLTLFNFQLYFSMGFALRLPESATPQVDCQLPGRSDARSDTRKSDHTLGGVTGQDGRVGSGGVSMEWEFG